MMKLIKRIQAERSRNLDCHEPLEIVPWSGPKEWCQGWLGTRAVVQRYLDDIFLNSPLGDNGHIKSLRREVYEEKQSRQPHEDNLVIAIEFAGRTMLVTGDASGKLFEILRREHADSLSLLDKVKVLIAQHPGSSHHGELLWLRGCLERQDKVRFLIISSDPDSQQHLPDVGFVAAVNDLGLEIGREVFVTSKCGANFYMLEVDDKSTIRLYRGANHLIQGRIEQVPPADERTIENRWREERLSIISEWRTIRNRIDEEWESARQRLEEQWIVDSERIEIVWRNEWEGDNKETADRRSLEESESIACQYREHLENVTREWTEAFKTADEKLKKALEKAQTEYTENRPIPDEASKREHARADEQLSKDIFLLEQSSTSRRTQLEAAWQRERERHVTAWETEREQWASDREQQLEDFRREQQEARKLVKRRRHRSAFYK
jgi:hypothetical protein